MAPGFERVRDAFGGNFEHGGDVAAALCVYRHGRKVADLRGGLAEPGPEPEPSVGPGHAAAGVLGDQGGHGNLRAPARAAGRARPGPAGRRRLARVRGAGQGGYPGPLAAVAPGRAARHRPPHPAGQPAGLGSDGSRAGRPAAGVGARHRPRIPRQDVRLAGRRGHQAGQRPQRGDVLRRGDRRAGLGSTSTSGCLAAERGRVSQMVIDDPPGPETVASIPVEQVPEQFRPLLAAVTDPDRC